jgi:hypothetical protein
MSYPSVLLKRRCREGSNVVEKEMDKEESLGAAKALVGAVLYGGRLDILYAAFDPPGYESTPLLLLAAFYPTDCFLLDFQAGRCIFTFKYCSWKQPSDRRPAHRGQQDFPDRPTDRTKLGFDPGKYARKGE